MITQYTFQTYLIDIICMHIYFRTDGPHSYDLALIHIEPKGDGVGIR